MHWLNRVSPQLRIVWSGASPAGWVEPPRRLYDHELVVVARGQCTIAIGRRHIACKAPYYLIVPPNTLHTTRQQGPGLVRHCLHFDWTATERPAPPGHSVFHPGLIRPALIHPAPDWVPAGPMHGPILDLVHVETLMAELLRFWAGPDPVLRAACQGLLLAILLLLLTPRSRGQASTSNPPSLASRIRALLDGPVSQQDSVQALLETLGFSYAHLCRLFRRSYGVTPVRYLNALRIERAKSLLRHSGHSVTQIATQAGFNNPEYFSRLFHTWTGTTPSAFRTNTPLPDGPRRTRRSPLQRSPGDPPGQAGGETAPMKPPLAARRGTRARSCRPPASPTARKT